jgi:hypothetical protein
MFKRTLIALAAVALVCGGAVAVAYAATGSNNRASCTANPDVVDKGKSQQITIVCTVPKQAAGTVTSTATATQTVTQTATATATASAPGGPGAPTQSASAPPSSTATATASAPTSPATTPTTTAPTTPPPSTPPPSAPGNWPGASNTGVPAGTSLSAYTGPSNITTPNTVITGKNIGCIQVSAPGVVIRNSKLSCRTASPYVVTVDDGDITGTPLLLQDVEIDCQNTAGTAVGEATVTVQRANIHGCENGVDANQSITIEDSYIHDLYNSAASHTDGIQLATGHWTGSSYAPGALNVTISHNTIYGVGVDGSLGTSAIIQNSPGSKNILIEDNLLAGGAFTLYCPSDGGGHSTVIGNHFSSKFSSKYGAYGPSDGCSDETLSGNVDDDTGNPLRLS